MHIWQSAVLARDRYGRIRISCPPERAPAPGQYLLAQAAGEAAGLLAAALFPAEEPAGGGLWCAPRTPSTWLPGLRLHLRGPLGRGFHLPPGTRRLAVLSLDSPPWRLMPLIRRVLHSGGEAALFAAPSPRDVPLPAALEALPPASLPEALQTWCDYWAADLPLARLSDLPAYLGASRPAAEGEALVATPMPCGGLAACGVCALPGSGLRLACKDGPVFPWRALL